jgi:hypothetical protein
MSHVSPFPAVSPAPSAVPGESPYLSLRRAVRPAMFAYRLLAGDAERAGWLAAECEDLLRLTRELLTAAGRVRLLVPSPGSPGSDGRLGSDDSFGGADGSGGGAGGSGGGAGGSGGGGAERQEELLNAYADAAMGWAKVVGGLAVLGGRLVEHGDWDEVRRLADLLQEAGEARAASDLRLQLGRAVWVRYGDRLGRITNVMPAGEIGSAIAALRAVLREVPEDFPDRNREVNRLLAPLAAAILGVIRDRGIQMPYDSRVEHIATGGVAKYPDIVTISLDELSAEFEGLCR